MRLLKCEQKVKAFYEIMKQANKKNKGYVGRQLLQELLEADEDHPVY
jgi:bacterioferritin (cytochrome b1)